jgi:hypothetical protein
METRNEKQYLPRIPNTAAAERRPSAGRRGGAMGAFGGQKHARREACDASGQDIYSSDVAYEDFTCCGTV